MKYNPPYKSKPVSGSEAVKLAKALAEDSYIPLTPEAQKTVEHIVAMYRVRKQKDHE